MKLLQKNKIKSNNLNTELTEMGVFSAVAGNQLPNQLQKTKKSTTGSLPPAVPLAAKTFRAAHTCRSRQRRAGDQVYSWTSTKTS